MASRRCPYLHSVEYGRGGRPRLPANQAYTLSFRALVEKSPATGTNPSEHEYPQTPASRRLTAELERTRLPRNGELQILARDCTLCGGPRGEPPYRRLRRQIMSKTVVAVTVSADFRTVVPRSLTYLISGMTSDRE